jgi:predicted metal-dependent enzyme (double-stranded beta helix superfamily)
MKVMIEEIRTLLKTGEVDANQVRLIQEVVMDSMETMVDRVSGRDFEPGRYLLYKDPDFGFVVMMLVWAPGQQTPIHGHGTWGVEAVIKNRVRVTSYCCETLEARELGSVVLPPGSVAYVLPPDADIHKVEHFGDAQAITVHVYGKELLENLVFFRGVGLKGMPCSVKNLPAELDWFCDMKWCSNEIPMA